MDYSNMSPEELVAELSKRDSTIAKQEGVIIASKKAGEKTPEGGLSQEQIDEIVNTRVQSSLAKDKFYSNNDSLTEEQISTVEKYVSENNLSYDQAHSLVLGSDPANQNKANTNNAGIGNAGTQSGAFAGKMNYSEYNKMSPAEQESYDNFSTDKFGGVTFEVDGGGEI